MSTATTTRRESRLAREAEQARSTRSTRSARRRRYLVVPVAAGAVVVGCAGAAWALGEQVPRSTTVAGVDLGGLPRDEAADVLAKGLQRATGTPVEVVAGEATGQVDPGTAGLALDAAATVDAAAGAPADPRTLWRHLVGGGPVAPVTRVDDAALAAAVRQLATSLDAAPVEGSIGFPDGTATPTAPAPGRALQAREAARALAAGWLTDSRPLRLPVQERQPAVGQAAVEEAMASFARPATSAPLVVLVEGSRVELSPAALAPALSMTAEDGHLVPHVDGAVLGEAVQKADPEAFTAPKDATFALKGGRPVVVPAVDGERLDTEPLAQAALSALVGTDPASRTVTAAVVPAAAELTTDEAKALGVTEVVSEFATALTPDPLRTENLKTAARAVDGTLLEPGEVFSLNATLGRRTAANGYNEAPVISGGRLAMDVGGGVSQMATTLFNAMFFAGLEDVEHKPHSFYISRYPEGREATVNYGSIDMRFRNDSEHGILMQTWVAGGQLHARFWGTKVWDVAASKSERRNVRQPKTITDGSAGCVPQTPHPGFDVTVTRTFRRGGAVQRTQDFTTTYIPEDSVTCGAAAAGAGAAGTASGAGAADAEGAAAPSGPATGSGASSGAAPSGGSGSRATPPAEGGAADSTATQDAASPAG